MASQTWQTPFNSIIVGPSGSGKTTFLSRFIQHVDKMVDRRFIEIVYCYAINQPLYDTVHDTRVRFHEGIIKSSEFDPKDGPRLLILDDFLTNINTDVIEYFVQGGHHRDVSVFLLTQNMFSQGKGNRDISINSHYIVYMKSPRDSQQIATLARQISSHDSRYVVESYRDATSKAYGYLLFDFRQTTDDSLRLRTNVFPDDGGQIVYLSKTANIKPELLLRT